MELLNLLQQFFLSSDNFCTIFFFAPFAIFQQFYNIDTRTRYYSNIFLAEGIHKVKYLLSNWCLRLLGFFLPRHNFKDTSCWRAFPLWSSQYFQDHYYKFVKAVGCLVVWSWWYRNVSGISSELSHSWWLRLQVTRLKGLVIPCKPMTSAHNSL